MSNQINQILSIFGETKKNGEIEADWINRPLLLELKVSSPIAAINTIYGWVTELNLDIELPYDCGYRFEDHSVITGSANDYSWAKHVEDRLLGLRRPMKENDYSHIEDRDMMKTVRDLERQVEEAPMIEFVPCENISGLDKLINQLNLSRDEVIDQAIKAIVEEGKVSFSHETEILSFEAIIRPAVKGNNGTIARMIKRN